MIASYSILQLGALLSLAQGMERNAIDDVESHSAIDNNVESHSAIDNVESHSAIDNNVESHSAIDNVGSPARSTIGLTLATYPMNKAYSSAIEMIEEDWFLLYPFYETLAKYNCIEAIKTILSNSENDYSEKVAELERAYFDAWKARESLGDHKESLGDHNSTTDPLAFNKFASEAYALLDAIYNDYLRNYHNPVLELWQEISKNASVKERKELARGFHFVFSSDSCDDAKDNYTQLLNFLMLAYYEQVRSERSMANSDNGNSGNFISNFLNIVNPLAAMSKIVNYFRGNIVLKQIESKINQLNDLESKTGHLLHEFGKHINTPLEISYSIFNFDYFYQDLICGKKTLPERTEASTTGDIPSTSDAPKERSFFKENEFQAICQGCSYNSFWMNAGIDCRLIDDMIKEDITESDDVAESDDKIDMNCGNAEKADMNCECAEKSCQSADDMNCKGTVADMADNDDMSTENADAAGIPRDATEISNDQESGSFPSD